PLGNGLRPTLRRCRIKLVLPKQVADERFVGPSPFCRPDRGLPPTFPHGRTGAAPALYIWARIKVSGLVVKPVTTEVLGYAEVPLKQPEVTTLDGLTTSASSSGANAVRPRPLRLRG